jgi:anti-sigma regulatory factor (Ser/Thr protein kinase)/biotin operon repressor
MATRVRARGEDVRKFILENVEKHSMDVSKVTAEHFGITRQAVNKHLQRLTAENALTETGKTRSRAYKLCPLVEWQRQYQISPELAEDQVWTTDVKSVLGQLPDNVMNIWHHGFTEMFNNAIDHSEGTAIVVNLRKTATYSEMAIFDDGIGIFKKIQARMNLLDERHAILELSKGKLTTDPKNHSGEGIFFTSRMFDSFDILSGGVFFSHEFGKAEDWILERSTFASGTGVWMKLNNHTARTTRRVFDQYSGGEDYGFNKTVVPVKLAQYGNDQLISRSQAKRLLARVELFKVVVFDFEGLPTIGQAFGDEIFRVFAQRHPEIELTVIKANSEVKRMIDRAKAGLAGADEQKPT